MYEHYASAFSSPPRCRAIDAAAAGSPNRSNASSPVKTANVEACSAGDHGGLTNAHHPRHFEDSVAPSSYSFKTPRRFNGAMVLSEPSNNMSERGYNRTSPTSVVEFERVHAPAPACAKVNHRPMAAMYQYPEVSSPMDRKSTHHGDVACYGGERDDHFPPVYKSDAEGNHPTPQNLRDNPERQAKIKTELCQFWIEGKECPWDANCNFAHGEHELKFRYSTLLLMEGSGQIANAYTYLCRPCLTFVSTGACPFGRRCTFIHDPRIQGPIEYPSWLPMATSKTNAQIIVDPQAAHRESAIHQENPVIPQSIWQHCRPSLKFGKKSGDDESKTEFDDTYKIVCNKDIPVFLGSNERRPIPKVPEKLSELQRLCIVECFRASQDRSFLYSPTHSLRGELCMILQIRYFRLEDVSGGNVTKDAVVQEINLDEYMARLTPWSQSGVPYSPFTVIRGHEVAFAPKGDTTCNFSIWFDEDPVKLEQTQIKRSRRIKQKNKTNIKKGHTRPNANGALIVRTSPVDFRFEGPAIEPFVYMIPAEDDIESNNIIDGIIGHRIDTILLALNAPEDEERARALLECKQQLQTSFDALVSFHQKWMWPRREGLNDITYSTQAPPGNAITYTPKKADKQAEGLRDISNIWQCFVENMAVGDKVLDGKARLPVFHSLGLRSESRPVPRLPRADNYGSNNTWRQLLLGQSGEWSNARELYESKMRGSAPARNLPLSTIPFVQN